MNPRDPETIIADWLVAYNGDLHPMEGHRPAARQLIAWLRDEDWTITPPPTPPEPASPPLPSSP